MNPPRFLLSRWTALEVCVKVVFFAYNDTMTPVNMNTPVSSNDDLALRRIVRDAHPDAQLPPGFSASVWRRIQIHADAGANWGSRFDRLVDWCFLPRHALAGMASMIILGVLAGWLTSQPDTFRSSQEHYLALVNPYQAKP